MEAYKREFIQFLEGAGVLKFGDFTAKSGRKIPYFINAGDIKTGDQIAKLGEFYAKAYFEAVARVESDTQCDIVGHFDLLTKFNERTAIFDTSDPRYIRAGLEALDALLEKDVIFEVNTGAMARGYRTTPYPAPIFLRRIAEKRGNVTLNADAHRKECLTYGFDVALQILNASGIGSVLTMTKDGWKNIAI